MPAWTRSKVHPELAIFKSHQKGKVFHVQKGEPSFKKRLDQIETCPRLEKCGNYTHHCVWQKNRVMMKVCTTCIEKKEKELAKKLSEKREELAKELSEKKKQKLEKEIEALEDEQKNINESNYLVKKENAKRCSHCRTRLRDDKNKEISGMLKNFVLIPGDYVRASMSRTTDLIWCQDLVESPKLMTGFMLCRIVNVGTEKTFYIDLVCSAHSKFKIMLKAASDIAISQKCNYISLRAADDDLIKHYGLRYGFTRASLQHAHPTWIQEKGKYDVSLLPKRDDEPLKNLDKDAEFKKPHIRAGEPNEGYWMSKRIAASRPPSKGRHAALRRSMRRRGIWG